MNEDNKLPLIVVRDEEGDRLIIRSSQLISFKSAESVHNVDGSSMLWPHLGANDGLDNKALRLSQDYKWTIGWTIDKKGMSHKILIAEREV